MEINMQKTFILSTALALGCATADDVKKLEGKIDELTVKVDQLSKTPQATTKGDTANKADETAAQNLLKEVQDLMGKNDINGAKAKLAEMEKKYSTTRTFRRAQKLSKELEVFGKDAPKELKISEWYVGNAGSVDITKGTTLIVFWEVWCPHCKKEVPKLQKTFETYSKKGLQMVAVTKLSRSSSKEKVVEFLQENKVTYPSGKEDGTLSKHFNVSGIPAAAVVKDGKIVWRGHPARLSDDMLNGWL
jgi:thiol-disulfide isomerase/thioredoxin